MMNKEQNKALFDALQFAGLTELPEEWNGEDIWVKAVVEILRGNAKTEYAVATNENGKGKPNYIKTFGSTSIIKKPLRFFPYKLLQDKYKPSFKTKKEMQDYLLRTYPNDEAFIANLLAKAKSKDENEATTAQDKIEQLINMSAIEFQIMKEEEDRMKPSDYFTPEPPAIEEPEVVAPVVEEPVVEEKPKVKTRKTLLDE